MTTTDYSNGAPVAWLDPGERYVIVSPELALDPDLQPNDVRVFIVLATYADREGECFPGRRGMAALLRVSIDTVDRCIGRLEKAGWLVKVKRRVGDTDEPDTNLYRLHRRPQGAAPTRRPDAAPTRRQEAAPVRPELEPVDLHPQELELRDDAAPVPEHLQARLDDSYFPVFWAAYPRKVGKPDAARKFRAALKVTTADVILDGLSRWETYWRHRAEPEFIPHPATWLNQHRWDDDPPPLPGPHLSTGMAGLLRLREARLYDEAQAWYGDGTYVIEVTDEPGSG